MKSTKGSPGGIESRKPLLSALPPVSYKTMACKELSLPSELFDEKTPFPSMAPLDPLMPIIAAKIGRKGPLMIIDGCKRYKKMLEKKQEKCVCGVFDGVLDTKSMGCMRIFLNQKRQRTIRESVCFYKWLYKIVKEATWRKRWSSLVLMPPFDWNFSLF
jgi:hypothetical protein